MRTLTNYVFAIQTERQLLKQRAGGNAYWPC